MLRGRTILDVGSRIGAFLYGAYVYTSDAKIVGIEMNADLCAIQQKIVDKFRFNDRIKIVNEDVMNCPELVSTSDFIFLHNVFEFFVSNDQQTKIWQFLKQNIKKKATLITIPSLEAMTKGLLEVGNRLAGKLALDESLIRQFNEPAEGLAMHAYAKTGCLSFQRSPSSRTGWSN